VIAVDTNVLIRVLVDEPSQPIQVTAARALVSEAGKVFVPLVVLVEVVWVLESAYGQPKAVVVGTLEHLLDNTAYVIERDQQSRAALALFQQSNADFADCLILAGCQHCNLTLHTFDRRLAKLDGAAVVKVESGK